MILKPWQLSAPCFLFTDLTPRSVAFLSSVFFHHLFIHLFASHFLGLTHFLLCVSGGCGWRSECWKDQCAGDDCPGQDLPQGLRRNDDTLSCQGEFWLNGFHLTGQKKRFSHILIYPTQRDVVIKDHNKHLAQSEQTRVLLTTVSKAIL